MGALKRMLLAVVTMMAALSAVGAGATVSSSADGQIAFVRDNAIWVVNADGTGLRRVTHPKPGIRDAAVEWSPDGSQLAFVRTDGATCGLPCISVETVHSDGRGLTPWPGMTEPRWSPAGGRLASTEFFGVNLRGYATSSLEVADIRTGTSVVLAPRRGGRTSLLPLGYDISDYAWSPDGAWICFSRAVGARLRLAVVHPDGTGLRLLSIQPGLSSCDWAPDSLHIALSDGRQIYSMAIHETVITALTDRAAGEAAPKWSPDGTAIAFLRQEAGSKIRPYDLWTMAADGSAQKRIAADVSKAAWSPDGTRIAFITPHPPSKANAARAEGLWMAPLDGSSPVEVAAGASDLDWQRAH